MSEHEVTSQHRVDQFGRNEFWVTCTCGWESPARIFPSEAHRDSLDHQGRRT